MNSKELTVIPAEQLEMISGGTNPITSSIELMHLFMIVVEFTNYVAGVAFKGCDGIATDDYFTQTLMSPFCK